MKKYFSSILFIVSLLTSSYSFAQFDRSKRTNDNGENNSNTNTNQSNTSTNSNNAEEEPEIKGFDKRKMIYGGNVALGFGSTTYVQASPILGYRIHGKVGKNAIGIGVSGNYVYSNSTWIDPATALKVSSIYKVVGAGVWGRYYAWEDFFFVGEFQMNRIFISQNVVNNNFEIKSEWYQSILLGVGYRQKISNKASIEMILEYDAQQQYPQYKDIPVIKSGFIYGI